MEIKVIGLNFFKDPLEEKHLFVLNKKDKFVIQLD